MPNVRPSLKIAVVLAVALASCGGEAELNWVAYEAPDGSYAASFPSTPEEREESVLLFNETRPLTIRLAEAEGRLYEVWSIPLASAPATADQRNHVVWLMPRVIAERVEAIPITDAAAEAGGLPARSFSLRLPSSAKFPDGAIIRGKAVLDEDLVTVAVAWHEDKAGPEGPPSVQKFLADFR